MARSDKPNDATDPVKRAAAKHEKRLEKTEDHLEKAAHRTEESFYEHGAKPEEHLEETEDHLEKAAHRTEESFYEHGAKPEEHVEETEDHLEKAARKADARGEPGREAG